MSGISLPAPVNKYAGEDALKGVTAQAGAPAAKANGGNDQSEYRPPKKSDSLKEGLIFPAKAIRGK